MTSPWTGDQLLAANPSPSRWSLGVLLYEMILGRSPFMYHEEEELFRMIRENPVKYPTKTVSELLDFPRSSSPPARVQVCQAAAGRAANQGATPPPPWTSPLLQDPAQRLGKDSRQLQAEPFFQGINWQELEEVRAAGPGEG